MKFLKFSLILSFIALFIFACAENKPTNTATNTNARSNTAAANTNTAAAVQPTAAVDELAAARKSYNDKCVSCHKEDGTGGKVTIEDKTLNVDNLTTEKMKAMSDEKYFNYIKNGVPGEGMPAFKNQLTDDQIREVVKFIRRELHKN